MEDISYFNDTPIASPKDDCFGINPFAIAISDSLKKIKSPIGVAIALHGPWGSGKSSAVNLIRHHLSDEIKAENIEIIDFKCWWFKGEEALTLAFLQELNSTLRNSLGDKVKGLIPSLGRKLLQAGPVVGPAVSFASGGWGALLSGALNFTKKFFPDTDNTEKVFSKLSKILADQEKRFLVIIDDIDRLTPEEALMVFRLVKSVGRLPNVIYLLVFDRELAENAVSNIYPSEGPHFLEKILQTSFEIPLPAKDVLNSTLQQKITEICDANLDNVRTMNVFYDAISPYINTPRDLTRLINTISISWPAVAGEVNVIDFVAMETMRLFEPKLYNKIRVNKRSVCGVGRDHGSTADKKKQTANFLEDIVPESKKEQVECVLMRLFPRFEANYSTSIPWDEQRLVCSDKNFETYFRMSISEEDYSASEIEELINRTADTAYVKEFFLKAVATIRKSGKSKVPLLLDELITHGAKIKKENYPPFFNTLFEIADDIYRDEDKDRGSFAFGDNHIRIHWLLRRSIFNTCSLEERSQILLDACQQAQLGWLVGITASADKDINGKDPEPPEGCLVIEDHLKELIKLSLQRIQSAADNGTLIDHFDLLSILFRWRDFAKDGGKSVKEWMHQQITDTTTLSKLATAFTGEGWITHPGMFGLGDRVSERTIEACVSSIEDLVDVNEFRKKLEEAEGDNSLAPDIVDPIKIFLTAWRNRKSRPR